MARSKRAALGLSALLLGVVALGACSSDDGENDPPCTIEPAFQLSVRAVSGELPSDTVIKAQYGGGVEEFHVDVTNPTLEVLLCVATSADAGVDAGAGVQRIDCKLWAQGAATVTVTASGYPDLVQELEAQLDGECFKTVPVDLVLGDEDGGS